MQPEPADIGSIDPDRIEMAGDVLHDERAHLLEHRLTVLAEHDLVRIALAVLGLVEEAEIVADVVRELRGELGAEHIPPAVIAAPVGHCVVGAFEHQGRARITEDEVEVAQLEVVVARRDLGVDDHDAARRAVAQGVDRVLDRERRRRAGHVHVERPAAGTELVLDLDRHGRVRALQVGAPDDHGVDVARPTTGLRERLEDRRHRHLGLNAQLVLAAQRQDRSHPVRVEHARLLHHVARPDARRLLDERLVGQVTCGHGPRGDLVGVVGVPLLDRRASATPRARRS